MPTTIRLATADDAAQVQAIYAPYCHTPISFELEPPPVSEMRQRIEKVLPDYPWLVLEEAGSIRAYAYASRHRERAAYAWSIDTSVYVHPDERRRGLGRALYGSLFALLPLQGYVSAYAGVTLPNPASVGLHEAMGFRQVGVYEKVGFKCGAWYDVVWLQRLLQPCPAEPGPVKSMAEVTKLPEWKAALSGASGTA
jgi:phosphinothricin acetyltransferase